MTATFTVTPQPSHVPPRVRLDFDTGSVPDVWSAITVLRDGVEIRTEPPLGSSVTTTYDYEAAFNAVQTWVVDAQIAAAGVADWTEAWASLAAWTGATGSWSVGAGLASSAIAGAAIVRPASGTIGRVDVATPTQVRLELLDVSDVVVASVSSGASTTVLMTSSGAVSVVGTGDYSLLLSGGTATVAGSGWSASRSFSGTPVKVRLVALGATTSIGQIVETPVVSLTPYTTSATGTLSVDEAWLIHPASPDLSLSLGDNSGTDGLSITSDSAQTKTRAQQATVFSPVGRARQVVVTNGNRRDPDWSLVINAFDPDRLAALQACITDQTPLLLRIPPDFGWDLVDDFYSVGDESDQRLAPAPNDNPRAVTLAMTPVDPPVVTTTPQWTYATDLLAYPTYADSLAAEPTYLDRLVGPSS